LVHGETCASSADSIIGEKTIEQAIAAPLDAPQCASIRGNVARCCHPY
jgi:hypothetical protein